MMMMTNLGRRCIKFYPGTSHEGPEGEKMCSSSFSSTSPLDSVGVGDGEKVY